MFKTFVMAASLSLAVFSAHAATFTQTATPSVAVANQTTGTFTGTYKENITNPGLISGSRSVWENTPLDGSVYSSITGDATFVYGGLSRFFSLVWGSPDQYNTLEFWNGHTMVDSVLGGSLVPCCGSNGANSQVNILTNAGFNRVVFKSGSPAFEWANMSNVAPVPLPASGMLLLGAFAGIAALRRRKSV